MQELIQIIKQKRKESDISNTMLRFAQFEAEKLLEMEKQQIIDGYNKGTINGIDYPESNLPLVGEQYYNETFKTK